MGRLNSVGAFFKRIPTYYKPKFAQHALFQWVCEAFVLSTAHSSDISNSRCQKNETARSKSDRRIPLRPGR